MLDISNRTQPITFRYAKFFRQSWLSVAVLAPNSPAAIVTMNARPVSSPFVRSRQNTDATLLNRTSLSVNVTAGSRRLSSVSLVA
jgi:hypothetical protein